LAGVRAGSHSDWRRNIHYRLPNPEQVPKEIKWTLYSIVIMIGHDLLLRFFTGAALAIFSLYGTLGYVVFGIVPMIWVWRGRNWVRWALIIIYAVGALMYLLYYLEYAVSSLDVFTKIKLILMSTAPGIGHVAVVYLLNTRAAREHCVVSVPTVSPPELK